MRRFALLLTIALAASGCNGKEPAHAFAACKRDSDCEEGLFCAQGGPIRGHCARLCHDDSECIARYGISHMCGEAVCTQICGRLADCAEREIPSFEACGAGLSCRAENEDRCASQCAVSTWGTEWRLPGLQDDFDSISVIGGTVSGVRAPWSPAGAVTGGLAPGPSAGGALAGVGGTPGGIGGTVGGALGGTTAGTTTPRDAGGGGGMDRGADASAPGDGASDAGADTGSAAMDAARDTGANDAAPPSPQHCTALPSTNDYGAAGPFDARMFEDVGPNREYVLFRPDQTLGRDGFRHPVVAFASALVVPPRDYRIVLLHLASHGFVVISCVDTFRPDRSCLDQSMAWLSTQNASGELAGKLDLTREATMGHDIGGRHAIEAADRANVKATVSVHGLRPRDGGTPDPKGPLLLLASTGDQFAVDENGPALSYATSNDVPTFLATYDDASVGHFITAGGCPDPPCTDGRQYAPALAAWLRLWLCGDQGARGFFMGNTCTLCGAPWAPAQRKPASAWQ